MRVGIDGIYIPYLILTNPLFVTCFIGGLARNKGNIYTTAQLL